MLDGPSSPFIRNRCELPTSRRSLICGTQRWLAKFEHRDKWNFCLNSAIMPLNRRAYDEAYPP